MISKLWPFMKNSISLSKLMFSKKKILVALKYAFHSCYCQPLEKNITKIFRTAIKEKYFESPNHYMDTIHICINIIFADLGY